MECLSPVNYKERKKFYMAFKLEENCSSIESHESLMGSKFSVCDWWNCRKGISERNIYIHRHHTIYGESEKEYKPWLIHEGS